MRPVLLALLIALVAAPAAQAKRAVETVFVGRLSASLSWTPTRGVPSATGLHVRIRRAGKVMLDRDYPYGTVPARDLPKGKSIALRNLDDDGRLEVMVDTFTSGAHCCFHTDVFDYAGPARYRRAVANWRDAGYRLRDLDGDGPPEFVSADARFAYEFAPYAFSGFPSRIWRFRGGRFRLVTDRYPRLVRRNATLWHDKATSARGDTPVAGYLAAYAGDMATLGRRSEGLAEVRRLRRGGRKLADRIDRFLTKLRYPADDATAMP